MPSYIQVGKPKLLYGTYTDDMLTMFKASALESLDEYADDETKIKASEFITEGIDKLKGQPIAQKWILREEPYYLLVYNAMIYAIMFANCSWKLSRDPDRDDYVVLSWF